MRTVAALYVDPKGPYPKMDGVECWDERRDARLYAGPHPVVAHPPCGPWSRLKHFCKHQDASCGPRAVEQVREHGGVLEHPADSKLWLTCGLPLPGELPDVFGGFTLRVNQCDWGHVTRKPTWLYLVGVALSAGNIPPPREPTHSVCNGRGQRLADGTERARATASQARVTPTAFATWLVALAMTVACSFELPEQSLDAVADYALLQTLPEPGPRPASFECTLGAVTVWGDDPHITRFEADGFEPVTVYSEDDLTDIRMGDTLVVVVGDLLVVGSEWVRLGDCEGDE